jgi:hypothetical protein
MPDVEKAIERYNDVIGKLKDTINTLQDQLRKKEKDLNDAINEIKRMNIEMSVMEVPDLATSQEHMILTEFKNRKETKNKDAIPQKSINIDELLKEQLETDTITEISDQEEDSDDIDAFKIVE